MSGRMSIPDDRVSNEIYDAVQSAICAGMTPERFLDHVTECWKLVLSDDAKAAEKVFQPKRIFF